MILPVPYSSILIKHYVIRVLARVPTPLLKCILLMTWVQDNWQAQSYQRIMLNKTNTPEATWPFVESVFETERAPSSLSPQLPIEIWSQWTYRAITDDSVAWIGIYAEREDIRIGEFVNISISIVVIVRSPQNEHPLFLAVMASILSDRHLPHEAVFSPFLHATQR